LKNLNHHYIIGRFMLKAIIFDADGTLYNVKSRRAYFLAADFLSEKTGIPAETINAEWKKIIDEIKASPEDSHDPEKRQRKYALEKTLLRLGAGKEKIDSLIFGALDIFWGAVLQDMEIFPEVSEILEKLGKNYVLVVASEEFRENLILKLNRAFGDWKKYFKILITPEVTGMMKPSEKYYEAAIEKLALKNDEVLAAGDSDERDLEPAKNLGIKTIKISPCEFGKLIEKILTKK